MSTDIRPLHLDSNEIDVVKRCPAALRWIADYHSFQESGADAMGYEGPAKYHEKRAAELNAAADEAQRKADSGDA